MKTAVVNFASKGTWCEECAKRMVKTFMSNGFDGDYLLFDDESDLGCPLHSEVPYAFKPYAFREAQRRGYDIILWVDSSISLLRPASLFIEQIEKDGYLLLRNGWTSGQWCSDAALKTLGITREESFEYPHLMACVMGLDMRNVKAVTFLDQYYKLANDGITFKGAWSNNDGEVSSDSRVLGHRHDQTAASVISWKLGMRNWLENWLVYDEGDVVIPEKTVFTLRHGL